MRQHRPETLKAMRRARKLKVAGRSYSEIARLLRVSPGHAAYYLRPPNLDRKGKACEGCGRSGIVLSCHHKSYDTNDDISLLCFSCHSKLHGWPKVKSKPLPKWGSAFP